MTLARSSRHRWRYSLRTDAVPVVIVVVTVTLALVLAPAALTQVPHGEPPPDWVDLDGETWTVEDLQGRWVLLDFWATWCTPCRAEIPHLKQLHERHPDQLIVLGVSVDRQERRSVLRFLRRQGIEWPQVHDGRGFDGALARHYGVESVPASVLLDPAGRIVARDLRGEVLVAAVDSLVGAEPRD